MSPTAATGVACTSDEPVAIAALSDVELVIIPQPRFSVELPVAVMPVVAVGSRLTTQYAPVCTVAAVAEAWIAGDEDMNSPEKCSGCVTDSTTRTAFVVLATAGLLICG